MIDLAFDKRCLRKKTIAHLASFCLIFIVFFQECVSAKLPLLSGLPIPRFAALRSGDVNMRTGPGTRYPISWVIKKKFLPVKVIAEHENWRKIELHDGTIGWVFQSMLAANKTALIAEEKSVLRKSPDSKASILATLGKGIVTQLELCRGSWCKVSVPQYKGWVERNHLWGVEFDRQ